MAKSLRSLCGPGLLLVLWVALPARAQQINPESLLPSNSVSLGSLQERRPGRLIQDAIGQHREFSNRAFGGRQGTPSAESELDPTFYEAVIADVLNLVLERIQLLLFGSQLLDSLDDLFAPDDTLVDALDDMSGSDDTSDDALRARATDSPNDDVLLDAFRARTSARRRVD